MECCVMHFVTRQMQSRRLAMLPTWLICSTLRDLEYTNAMLPGHGVCREQQTFILALPACQLQTAEQEQLFVAGM